jgi:Arc/MetJ-type ribon-helix-helix transcriptional regulator
MHKISVSFPDDQYDMLIKIAAMDERTVSSYIRKAVKRMFQQNVRQADLRAVIADIVREEIKLNASTRIDQCGEHK